MGEAKIRLWKTEKSKSGKKEKKGNFNYEKVF